MPLVCLYIVPSTHNVKKSDVYQKHNFTDGPFKAMHLIFENILRSPSFKIQETPFSENNHQEYDISNKYCLFR